MLKILLVIVSLLVVGFVVLLLNSHIDQSPSNSPLTIISKNNQPCFYIDDDSFTRKLPEQTIQRIQLYNLAISNKEIDSTDRTLSYAEKLMPTPKNKDSCFFLPNPKDLIPNNPYNIYIPSGFNSNFCLTPTNNGFIATQVKFQADPNHEKNATPICTQQPFEEKRTMAEAIKKWLTTF